MFLNFSTDDNFVVPTIQNQSNKNGYEFMRTIRVSYWYTILVCTWYIWVPFFRNIHIS
jgi:hypothetical protein